MPKITSLADKKLLQKNDRFSSTMTNLNPH